MSACRRPDESRYLRFPRDAGEVPKLALDYLAGQLKVPSELFLHYEWTGSDDRVSPGPCQSICHTPPRQDRRLDRAYSQWRDDRFTRSTVTRFGLYFAAGDTYPSAGPRPAAPQRGSAGAWTEGRGT